MPSVLASKLGGSPMGSPSNVLSSRWRAALLAASGVVGACGDPPAAKAPSLGTAPESGSTNWVCRGIVGHFLGLPSSTGDPGELAPAAGCWWVRGCELGLTRSVAGAQELEAQLEGPGWYWIDFEEGDFQLHQQVPFELAANIAGSVRFAYSGGVASFWFEPTREPHVVVEASKELELHGSTLWGSVLRRIPLVPIRRMTADRLSDSAAAAFAAQIQRGVTVTYDVTQGQADMALGALRLGETPRRVFEDGTAWIENTRLLLPAGATHVFGPLEPLPIDVDVVIERGPGIAYQALCTRDMASCFDDVAAGQPERIPRDLIVDSGTLTGLGAHVTRLHVGACPHYLVVASAREETTLVALRLRSGVQ
jgi:hypothetical protein